MVQESGTIKDSELKKFVEANFHRIRHCSDYKMEYKECTSMRGRFHQYFIFGESSDCMDLRTKWENCDPCIYEDNYEACTKIIQLEDKLKEKRLKNHLANDIWDRRKKPPEGWDAKLPDFAQMKTEFSFKQLEESKCTIF